jgi:hypothetical protein
VRGTGIASVGQENGRQVTIRVGEFSTPFDEFEHPSRSVPPARLGIVALWVQAGLRGLSFGALWVAILAAGFLIARHLFPLMMGSTPPISFKSAVPLIAIGISYFVLILSLRRTLGQRLVGIFVGLAFSSLENLGPAKLEAAGAPFWKSGRNGVVSPQFGTF